MESSFSGAFGQGSHLPMVQVRSSVEDHFLNVYLLGSLSNASAHISGHILIKSLTRLFAKTFVQGGSGSERYASAIINNLSEDVLVRAENRQTGSVHPTPHPVANPRASLVPRCILVHISGHH